MSNIKTVIELPEEVKVMITRVGLSRIPDEMKEIVDWAIQGGRTLASVLSNDKAIGSVAILSLIHDKGLEDEIFKALLEYEIREEYKLMHNEEKAEDKGLEEPEEDGVER